MQKKVGNRTITLSLISTVHYYKLLFRSALFLVAAVLYILNKVKGSPEMFYGYEHKHPFLIVLWLIFFVEMISRFFPSKLESMGCEKQFKKNYDPRPNLSPEQIQSARERYRHNSWKQTLPVLGSWIALNGAIGLLYLWGIIDWGILVLIALAYSICDIICILFFCPFQTWMMKNKCCGTCRIYNWDYAMMCTPLIFVNDPYARSILVVSLVLLFKWEYVFHKHPEYFSEETNCSLSCASCPEKLCHHKKQLRSFLKDHKHLLQVGGFHSGNEMVMTQSETADHQATT